MKHRMMAAFIGCAALVLGALALSACNNTHADTQTSETASPIPLQSGDAAQIARGRYLAKVADCAACHTSANGAPFAGGVKLDSPFGTFYGTNITPDRAHGIGDWSADDFWHALHDGVSPKGQLYPAMPYTSYRQLTREDSDALYAYLMSMPPAFVKDKEPELSFPFNLRFGVWFWKLLFLKDAHPDASSGNSAAWQRGRYLATALGHCAECHTPRGAFGQLDDAKPFGGGSLGRVTAPGITPALLAQRGWTASDLRAFFATGIAPQGSAFGEMHPVVQLSTQYLADDDLRAMATYLLGDSAPAPQPLQAPSADAAQWAAGRSTYLAVCAGCHGAQGEGKPHVAVALRGNSTLRQHDARNLIVSVLDGIDAQRFPGLDSLQDMPGFATALSNEEVAQLANYLRSQWGNETANIGADRVRALRR